MRYRIDTPPLTETYLKSRLLDLPALGNGLSPAAVDVLHAIYKTPARPGLMVDQMTVFSDKGIFAHSWIYEFDHGVIAIQPDLSVLIYARTEKADLFEVLPLAFQLPYHVPAPVTWHDSKKTGMVFDHPGVSHVDFGIRPQFTVDEYYNLRNPDPAPKHVVDIAGRIMGSLSRESADWIAAYRKSTVDLETSLPVAISVLKSPPQDADPTEVLRSWMHKVVTYAGHCLNTEGNIAALTVNHPSYRQEDGRLQLDVHAKISDEDHPLKSLIEDHLQTRVLDLMRHEQLPFDLTALFPRISIDSDEYYTSIPIQSLNLTLEAFALVPLSHHQKIQMEAQFGLQKRIAEATAAPASQ